MRICLLGYWNCAVAEVVQLVTVTARFDGDFKCIWGRYRNEACPLLLGSGLLALHLAGSTCDMGGVQSGAHAVEGGPPKSDALALMHAGRTYNTSM